MMNSVKVVANGRNRRAGVLDGRPHRPAAKKWAASNGARCWQPETHSRECLASGLIPCSGEQDDQAHDPWFWIT